MRSPETDHAQAVAGWMADRGSSRRAPFLVGLGILFFSTLLFALGSSLITLMAARCLQGAAAGFVYTVGLALLVDTVGGDQVGSWMGFTISGMTLGLLLGPMLGGLIYEKSGYFAVFAVALAVIAFDFVLPLLMIEKRSAQKWLESPSERNGYGTMGNQQHGDHVPWPTVCTVNPKPQTDDSGSSSEVNDEQRPLRNGVDEHCTSQQSRPGIAIRLAECFPTTYALISSQRLAAALYGGFVQVALICSFDGVLPLFVHRTFGWDSSGMGLIFLAISIPALAGSLAGALSDRLGTRVVVLGGFAISTAALALLSLVTDNSIHQKVLLCALLAIISKSLFSSVESSYIY